MATDMRFEWDPRKAAINKRKHGISFELASLIFDDPIVEEYEEAIDNGEIRYRALGTVGRELLFVVYTSFAEGDEEVIRIISARKATPRERRAHERQSRNDR